MRDSIKEFIKGFLFGASDMDKMESKLSEALHAGKQALFQVEQLWSSVDRLREANRANEETIELDSGRLAILEEKTPFTYGGFSALASRVKALEERLAAQEEPPEVKVFVDSKSASMAMSDAVDLAQASDGAAGFDLRNARAAFMMVPGERITVGTGVYLEIPEGYEGQIRPRSGLAALHGITVLNSPATIDSDYRGEVKVILHNTSKMNPYTVAQKERIAQMVFAKVSTPKIRRVSDISELSATERGDGGFGSTGK